MTAPRRVVVIQDGARLHYAVPLAFEQAGILERVYTNWYSAPGRMDRMLARVIGMFKPREAQRLRARFCPELPAGKVRSNPWHALRATRARRRFTSEEAYFRWESDEFARWVEREGFGNGDALYGFVRNISPHLLQRAKNLGLTTIVDQIIAPRVIELRQERVQHERFPGWGHAPPPAQTDSVVDLEQETWALADRITCASEYVRRSLEEAGLREKHVSVLPYPIDARHFPCVDRRGRTGPLTVGFVGAVGLRKGTPYFFEVAKRLAGAAVTFEMIGPIQLSAHGQAQRGPVTLRGALPRDEIPKAMGRFDVFLFPSTCEGSAQVVSEALASGLPVACSENSGSPETLRDAGQRLRYDDIEGYCAALLPHLVRGAREAAAPVKVPGLASYREGFLKEWP